MIPQRPARGRNLEVEAQILPVYNALDGRLGGDNLTTGQSGVMPITTSPGASGGLVVSAGANMAWHPTTVLLHGPTSTTGAGSTTVYTTGTATFTVSHTLGRTPQIVLPGLFGARTTGTAFDPMTVYVTRQDLWNTQAFILGVSASATLATASSGTVVTVIAM